MGWIPPVLALAGLGSVYFAPIEGGLTLLVGLAGCAIGLYRIGRRSAAEQRYEAALKEWHGQIDTKDVDAWRRMVEAEGWGEHMADFERGLRSAFRGMPGGEAGTRSRLGGQPDLPADFVWPGSEKQPWMFFFQVAFDELPEAKHDLPRGGTLVVFNEEPFSHGTKTFYFPAGVPLFERAAPAEAEIRPPVPLCFQAYEDIPDVKGCHQATTAEIRDYLAGDGLALHCHGSHGRLLLWRARDGYGMLTSAWIDTAELRARDFSRVSPYY